MPSDDLPGLEPDDLPGPEREPTPEKPFELPEIDDFEPSTYDGLTNAELDEWFETEYGGQNRFEQDFRGLLEDMKPKGSNDLQGPVVIDGIDPDLEAVLRVVQRHEDGWTEFDWTHLGPETKAKFRRFVNSQREPVTTPWMHFKILVSAAFVVFLGGVAFLAWVSDDATPPTTLDGTATTTEGDSPVTTLENTATTAGTDSPPTTLEEGADPEGDMFGSGESGDADSVEAAASDITATTYFVDDGVHVFQMKVRGDGEALAHGDVSWYNPRFIIQTSQGEFTIDVDATDGTARVIDPGPFSDPQQISVEVDWLQPGCLQVAATIIGLTEEAESLRTELVVRLTDGTDFSDDASFSGG